MHSLPDPFLCVITDDTLGDGALLTAAEQAVSGARCTLQLRARNRTARDLFAIAERLRAITRTHGCEFVVNERVDIALAVGADGVHVPSASMPSDRVRELIGPSLLLGRSVHSLAEIEHETALAAADYLQFGPVFATPSKAAYGAPQGLARLAHVVSSTSIPVVAVGGITQRNARQVLRAGARGIAVIAAVMQASDPGASAHELMAIVADAGQPEREPRRD